MPHRPLQVREVISINLTADLIDSLTTLSYVSQVLHELILEDADPLKPINGMVQAHCESILIVEG